jgi:flavin reductase (DIM6/NTAB) family NADH-FMN oxidoreductase RutF
MNFKQCEFRDTLAQFPTGVMVLTAGADAQSRMGMTMSSFNSVSLDPALILFSIARSTASFDFWLSCERFAINVLGEHQEHLSNRFAGRLGPKWDGLEPVIGESGVPLLPDTLAAFECEPYASYDGGDHVIMVAKVLALHRAPQPEARPLIFYGGNYRKIDGAERLTTTSRAV